MTHISPVASTQAHKLSNLRIDGSIRIRNYDASFKLGCRDTNEHATEYAASLDDATPNRISK